MSSPLDKIRALFGSSKPSEEAIPYDPETEEPVIRASICTGEREAGLRSKKSGEFIPFMLIKDERELRQFAERCGVQVEDIETIY